MTSKNVLTNKLEGEMLFEHAYIKSFHTTAPISENISYIL